MLDALRGGGVMRTMTTTGNGCAFSWLAVITTLAACSRGESPGAADTTTASATVPAQSAAPSAVGVRLAVAQSSGIGPYLTDAKGRSVYLFLRDVGDSSSCYDACAAAWPPVLAAGGMVAGDSAVRQDLLGVSQRRDGATQVTYKGAPLYYYEDGKRPGDITGQDKEEFGGKWYLVSPTGGKQEGKAPASKGTS
jgi:predicted lipoprotein with Yx(FWY)xxD motif